LSSSVGHWPRSSAYYALDVLYDNYANTHNGDATNTNIETTSSSNSNSQYHPPVPKLVEINYMGDWKALKKITVLENEERRAKERANKTEARTTANVDSNLNVDSSVDSAVNPVSTTHRVPDPDSTATMNHNSDPPVGEIDEVMLEWVEDLLTVLSTSNPPNPDRCIPLHHNKP